MFDENGERIRGVQNRQVADVALAREKLRLNDGSSNVQDVGSWLVARVCSEYLLYCEKRVEKGEMSDGHLRNSKQWLNDLCGYCGALPIVKLKKRHIQKWIDSHDTWKSPATRRSVIAIVLAAFNRTDEISGIANPLKGLRKPKSKPRLASISPEDETFLYEATDESFGNFLKAAIFTGLRPFCELARINADHVSVTERGMMWRVYSSKTQKTRKIPVRPEIAELTRSLIKTAPAGSNSPLFRNSHGRPWQPSAGVVRFISLKKKLNWIDDPVKSKYSCYTCRHTFAHRMLSGYWTNGEGCSIETLAELIGDTPKVAFDHYGREWGQHYQGPLWRAIGEA